MRRTALLVFLLLPTLAFASDPLERDRGPFRDRGQHFIVQTDGLTDADRADLVAKGVVFQRALTKGRSVARVADPARVAGDSRIALVPFTVEQKLQRSALREAMRAKEHAQLIVSFHEDVTFEEARQAILSAGGSLFDPLETRFGVMNRLQAFVPTVSVRTLASDDRVLALAGPVRMKMESHNAKSAEIAHVTELYSAPYNLSGEGVVISLYELAEAQGNHPEFQGRMTVHASGGSTGDKSHATHVAGTMGAGGVNPDAKGMAPKVQIHQYRASGSAEQWLRSKSDNLAPLSVIADNNSWGYVLGWQTEGGGGYPVWNGFGDYYGGYDLTLAAPIDQITREKGVLFVHSAGNDGDLPEFLEWQQHRHVNDDLDADLTQTFCVSRNGSGTDCPGTPTCTSCEPTLHGAITPYDTIGVTASAKNILTVGASDSFDSIIPFSSRGPAKDGRVKPDIVARGFNVLSAVPTNTYGRSNGTSMSAPSVTGIAAIVTEQWKRTFGASTTPGPMALKALLIAGARDLGNPGPDYTFGFGFVNAKASVDLIIADQAKGNRIRTGTLAQGQTYEMPLRVNAAQPLRVVLQWLDPEIAFLGGDDLAEVALVNNLDVKVIDPSGATVLPWVLDRINYNANATRGVNVVDNTEMIEIANATPGLYRVVVTATKIADRSPQPFILIANADAAPLCTDFNEPNDTTATAYGDVNTGTTVAGVLCSSSDVDFFRFTATKGGNVEVRVQNTGDTPLDVTLAQNGGNSVTINVAPGQTSTAGIPNVNASPANPASFTVRVSTTALGSNATYTITPNYGLTVPPRRRTVR
ncbi:MAG TPA: S8 family serine peptidase [Thermoanaerobaculia bacterium]|jgi:hypothetical protein